MLYIYINEMVSAYKSKSGRSALEEEDIFGFNLAYTDEILSELNKVLD